MDANPFGFIFALWRKAFSTIREDEKSSSLIVLFDALLRSFFEGVTQFATQITNIQLSNMFTLSTMRCLCCDTK